MRIREMRRRKGITQMEFAAKMGVAQSTVAQWETGARMPNVMQLPKIADVLGCTLDELYGSE